MKKKNIIISIIVIIIAILIATIVVLNNKSKNINNDALRFKEEYESLNNVVRDSDGELYNSVSINEDNPIKYVDIKETLKLLKNKKGILYIGANWCPWCRNAIEVLIDSANDMNLNEIYYLDLTNYRNVWEIIDKKLVKTQTESEGYYDLLDALDGILGSDNYKLKDDDGNIYDTGEKRIYMPIVIAFKDGKIVDHHLSTVTLKDNQTKYDKLDGNQYNELKKIYTDLIKSIK